MIIKQNLHPIGEPQAVAFTSLESVKEFAKKAGEVLIEDKDENYIVILIHPTYENVATVAKYFKL